MAPDYGTRVCGCFVVLNPTAAGCFRDRLGMQDDTAKKPVRRHGRFALRFRTAGAASLAATYSGHRPARAACYTSPVRQPHLSGAIPFDGCREI